MASQGMCGITLVMLDLYMLRHKLASHGKSRSLLCFLLQLRLAPDKRARLVAANIVLKKLVLAAHRLYVQNMWRRFASAVPDRKDKEDGLLVKKALSMLQNVHARDVFNSRMLLHGVLSCSATSEAVAKDLEASVNSACTILSAASCKAPHSLYLQVMLVCVRGSILHFFTLRCNACLSLWCHFPMLVCVCNPTTCFWCAFVIPTLNDVV